MARRARNARGALLEQPFQDQVVQLAGFYSWMAYHTHDSRRSARGFPDLVLARASTAELIFAELKTDSGRVRPEQEDWLEALRAVSDGLAAAIAAVALPEGAPAPAVDVYVWRPADWDEIHARLARARRQVPAGFDPRL